MTGGRRARTLPAGLVNGFTFPFGAHMLIPSGMPVKQPFWQPAALHPAIKTLERALQKGFLRAADAYAQWFFILL